MHKVIQREAMTRFYKTNVRIQVLRWAFSFLGLCKKKSGLNAIRLPKQ